MLRKLSPVVEDVTLEASSGRSRSGGRLLITLLSLAFVGALGVAGYFYYQFKHVAPATSSPDDTAKVMAEVGSLIELPIGETPTLATVTDKEKLAEQPFFQKAENGDKVIIYSASGRAILYRPATKKVVDMTTVNVNTNQAAQAAPVAQDQTPEPSVSDTVPATVRVALYNGSTKIGVTNSLEDEIVAKFSNITVEKKEKAAKSDYTGTLVIDLSGKNTELAASVAQAIGGTVGATLPQDEVNPGTDLLVIVGNK